MKATASPGETLGELSGQTVEVAMVGGGGFPGVREKWWAPSPYFIGLLWKEEGYREGAPGLCILLAAPDMHSPVTFLLHMLTV